MSQTSDIHVLYVDDEPNFADIAADMLEREDDRFTVETATSASEGLERLVAEGFDCIVSDYDMPGKNGIEFLEQVRDEYPDLPFILYTGKGSEEVASDAISAGVTDYLQKGGGTSQYAVLVNRIRNAVENYHAQMELTDRERHLNLFFEQSPFGVIEWDENFDFVRMNDVAEEILGYAEDDLAGRSWEAIVPESDRDAVADVVADLLENKGGYHSINENVRKDGEQIICEWHNRVVTDENEDVVAVFSQFHDVTKRIEREQAVKELHQATRELFTADSKQEVADCIAEMVRNILDYPSNVVRLVDTDEGVLRPVAVTVTAEEMLGDRPVYDIGEGTAGQAFEQGETLVYEDVRTVDDERDRGSARAGIYVPIGDHGTLSINDTERGRFDETDVRLAELLAANADAALDRVENVTQLQRQNDRLEEFTDIISHDLRNPLNVAEGELELAQAECDTPHLAKVEAALARMETLIDDLLTYARKGKLVSETEQIDLAALAESCWQTSIDRDATLTVTTEQTIQGDANRIQELLENLFRNSVDHADDSVTVIVGDLEDGFYVEDDGPGIPDDERDRIFERGYSSAETGTGFGLAIVKQIAEAHRWEISVSESEAGGARFEITGVDASSGGP